MAPAMTGAGDRAAPAPELSRDEAIDLLRRERADFLNYRRRMAGEREAEAARIRTQILEPIFPLIDELDRAFAEAPPGLRDDPWAQGVALARGHLKNALAGFGVEVTGAVGEPFDPRIHDAAVYEPSADVTDETVVAVIRPGYRLGDRVLRPAKVVVRGPLRGARADADGTAAARAATNARPTTQERVDDRPAEAE
jgi:molecular chaperone GrpE